MHIAANIQEYAGQVFKDLTLPREEILSKEFYDCTFIECSFTETIFSECKFVDCMFKNCDLSLMRVPGCSFTDTRFEDSRMMGVNWTEAAWPERKLLKPISFWRCNISHSTFMGLGLKEITLQNCMAGDVDFREADLTEADCTGTDFANSFFGNTNLTRTDFTQATNYTINASLNVLKQTKFSLPEAMALLHSLDIVLVDE